MFIGFIGLPPPSNAPNGPPSAPGDGRPRLDPPPPPPPEEPLPPPPGAPPKRCARRAAVFSRRAAASSEADPASPPPIVARFPCETPPAPLLCARAPIAALGAAVGSLAEVATPAPAGGGPVAIPPVDVAADAPAAPGAVGTPASRTRAPRRVPVREPPPCPS